jgi:hypothetical protein
MKESKNLQKRKFDFSEQIGALVLCAVFAGMVFYVAVLNIISK